VQGASIPASVRATATASNGVSAAGIVRIGANQRHHFSYKRNHHGQALQQEAAWL
jgi:hypothetical protein